MSTPHVTIKLPKELVDEMDKLKGKHGFRGRGEIAKEAIRQLLDKYKADINAPPRFVKINSDENGIKLRDNVLNREVDVYIKPYGVRCLLDDSSTCEHVYYALSDSDVRKIIRAKIKEGWKLPDV